MPLITLGINYKTAPVVVRERFVFNAETVKPALAILHAQLGVDEAAIVSTCNRTEIYLHLEDNNHKERIINWLADHHKLSLDELQAYLYEHNEQQTVKHILRVACGIDSMILGESQILGQLKDAYRYALDAGCAGPLLNRLFQYSFTVAKQVRTDTAIGSSPVSVAFAAVRLAKQIFGDLKRYTVLLIGAGETIELAARHLHDQGIGRIIVANRTIEHAQDLAASYSAYAISLNEIPAHLAEADIVISSTASRTPILEKLHVTQALLQRKHKPIFMVDLAVPRDIHPDIATLDDVYLYTIDDLHNVIQENLQSRQQAALQAEEIIDVQVEHFLNWKKSLEAVGTIRVLRGLAEAQRDNVMEKALAQLGSGKDPKDVLQYLAHTLTNKFIHTPSVNLRHAGAQGRYDLIRATRDLYDMDRANTTTDKVPDEEN